MLWIKLSLLSVLDNEWPFEVLSKSSHGAGNQSCLNDLWWLPQYFKWPNIAFIKRCGLQPFRTVPEVDNAVTGSQWMTVTWHVHNIALNIVDVWITTATPLEWYSTPANEKNHEGCWIILYEPSQITPYIESKHIDNSNNNRWSKTNHLWQLLRSKQWTRIF